MTKAKQMSYCFLVGAERSGTTWLQRMLQSHPAVCDGEESHFFSIFGHVEQVERWASDTNRSIGPLCYMTVDAFEVAIRELWNNVFSDLYESAPIAQVHLEKTPKHTWCLSEIVRIFPNASS